MGTSLEPTHTDLPGLQAPHPDHADCRGVASVLARVGDKWSVFVIMMLIDGPLRFNELKRMIGGISQRMLTLTLRGLERDGLVTRTAYPTIPPRVEYALTPLGCTLIEPLVGLAEWATENQRGVEKARAKFDAARAPKGEKRAPLVVAPPVSR